MIENCVKLAVTLSPRGFYRQPDGMLSPANKKTPIRKIVWETFFEAADGVGYRTHQGAANRNTLLQKARRLGARFVAGEINLLRAHLDACKDRNPLKGLTDGEIVRLASMRGVIRADFVLSGTKLEYEVLGPSLDGGVMLGLLSEDRNERKEREMPLKQFLEATQHIDLGFDPRGELMKLLLA